jgi:hypothetical protein
MQQHYSTVDVGEKREAMEAAMNVLKAAKAEGSSSKKGAGRTRERNLSLSKNEERPCPTGSLS